ncbi:MAG: DUF3667 domain-containing protein [Bacteroidota bacterium]
MNKTKEETSENLTLNKFIKSNASVMFGLDRRLWSTLKLLLLYPGRLTKEFTNGNEEKYTAPTTLYFTTNLLFFLLQPIINKGYVRILNFSYKGFTKNEGLYQKLITDDLQLSGLSEIVYEVKFDAFITYNQPALIFIMIPFLAIFLKVFELRKPTKVIDHIVQAFHFMSYFLIVFLLITASANLVAFLLDGTGLVITISSLVFIASIIAYMARSFSITSNNSIIISIVKALVFFVFFFVLFFGYVNMLIFFTILNVG